MSHLVISIFSDELRAEEARLDLLRRQHEHRVDLEDAVVVVRTTQNKVKTYHVSHLTMRGAVGGGFLGTLLGVILLNPVFSLFGLAAGTVIGAVSGSMSHAGVDEPFIHEFADHLRPGTSALCLLVQEHLEEVIEEIKGFGGKVIHTAVQPQDPTQLRALLESVESELVH